MSYLNLRVGDRVPADTAPSEPIRAQRGTLPDGPAWFVLRVLNMREGDVEAALRDLGVDEAWHPVKSTVWRVRGGPAHGKLRETISPAVPGYVLFRVTGHPRWDLIVGDSGVKGVIDAIGGVEPIRIKEDVVAQMEQVPEVLAEIIAEEKRRNTIVVGCSVQVVHGVLTGSQFTVIDLTDTEARGELAGFGRVSIRRNLLRKMA